MTKHLLLIAAITISVLGFSQQKTSFGIKAGISHSNLKGEAMSNLADLVEFSDGMIKQVSRTGFFAGGYASIPVGESISIEPGLYYAQKGAALRGDLDIKGLSFLGANAKAQVNSHYVDLPVVVKANLGGFQLFAGPQLSYLAKADLRTSAGALGFNVYDQTRDMTDELNRWDAGVTGGIGYQLNNGLNISASYDHGLTKADANRRLDTYNRSFKVGIGFKF